MKLTKRFVADQLLPFLGALFSMALLMFGIWQLDLVCVNAVWGAGFCMPPGEAWADRPFKCWLWEGTRGQAYDGLLFIIFSSFWLLVLSMWFWHRQSLRKYKKVKQCLVV